MNQRSGPIGNRTAPHVEAALNYHARANTTFRFYYSSGLEDTGSAGVQSSFSRRTGLSVTQRLARGLSFDAAVNYVNSDYTRGGEGIDDREEDTIYLSAGLNYSRHLWRRLYMNANYTFSTVSSDDPFSEYERHRVSLGVSATF